MVVKVAASRKVEKKKTESSEEEKKPKESPKLTQRDLEQQQEQEDEGKKQGPLSITEMQPAAKERLRPLPLLLDSLATYYVEHAGVPDATDVTKRLVEHNIGASILEQLTTEIPLHEFPDTKQKPLIYCRPCDIAHLTLDEFLTHIKTEEHKETALDDSLPMFPDMSEAEEEEEEGVLTDDDEKKSFEEDQDVSTAESISVKEGEEDKEKIEEKKEEEEIEEKRDVCRDVCRDVSLIENQEKEGEKKEKEPIEEKRDVVSLIEKKEKESSEESSPTQVQMEEEERDVSTAESISDKEKTTIMILEQSKGEEEDLRTAVEAAVEGLSGSLNGEKKSEDGTDGQTEGKEPAVEKPEDGAEAAVKIAGQEEEEDTRAGVEKEDDVATAVEKDTQTGEEKDQESQENDTQAAIEKEEENQQETEQDQENKEESVAEKDIQTGIEKDREEDAQEKDTQTGEEKENENVTTSVEKDTQTGEEKEDEEKDVQTGIEKEVEKDVQTGIEKEGEEDHQETEKARKVDSQTQTVRRGELTVERLLCREFMRAALVPVEEQRREKLESDKVVSRVPKDLVDYRLRTRPCRECSKLWLEYGKLLIGAGMTLEFVHRAHPLHPCVALLNMTLEMSRAKLDPMHEESSRAPARCIKYPSRELLKDLGTQLADTITVPLTIGGRLYFSCVENFQVAMHCKMDAVAAIYNEFLKGCEERDKAARIFYCDACRVVFPTSRHFLSHLLSEQHDKKMLKAPTRQLEAYNPLCQMVCFLDAVTLLQRKRDKKAEKKEELKKEKKKREKTEDAKAKKPDRRSLEKEKSEDKENGLPVIVEEQEKEAKKRTEEERLRDVEEELMAETYSVDAEVEFVIPGPVAVRFELNESPFVVDLRGFTKLRADRVRACKREIQMVYALEDKVDDVIYEI